MRTTFTTKSENWSGKLSVSVDLPASIEDAELIEARYGSVARMIEVANRGWVISCQNGMRKRGADEAKAYAAAYCDDGSRDFARPGLSEEDIEAGGFTPEQVALMRKKGFRV